MARSSGSFNKRDKEKQRQKEKQQKREKMEERKANNAKGKNPDDMIAYIDEDGNLSSTPPDPAKMRVFNPEDIEIGVPKQTTKEDPIKHGRVDYFDSSKGFGFIIPDMGEKIFFHVNQVTYPVSEGDRVTYTIERGPRGYNAAGVTKE